MTAGYQGAAYDKAQEALKKDPKNAALQAEAARTKS
jgi:hypothetical protein